VREDVDADPEVMVLDGYAPASFFKDAVANIAFAPEFTDGKLTGISVVPRDRVLYDTTVEEVE